MFGHFVVPFVSHEAFAAVSGRIVAAAISGVNDDDEHRRLEEMEKEEEEADDESSLSSPRGDVALFGDPSRRDTLAMLAHQLTRALPPGSRARVNPPLTASSSSSSSSASSSSFSTTTRLVGAVAFLTAGWTPPPPPPDVPTDRLALMRETDARPEYGAPTSLEASLEGAPVTWREAARASDDFGGGWGAVVPYYAIRDFRVVTYRLVAAKTLPPSNTTSAIIHKNRNSTSGESGGEDKNRQKVRGTTTASVSAASTAAEMDYEEKAAMSAEIERLRAEVARLAGEAAAAETNATHAAVGWPSPRRYRLELMARNKERSRRAADDAERRIAAARTPSRGGTTPSRGGGVGSPVVLPPIIDSPTR